jgi:ABC-2 type transport system permease protein
VEDWHEKIHSGGRIKMKSLEIIKHLKIYRQFIKMSVMQQLEYRVNFIMGFLGECVYLFSKMLYVMIVYRAGGNISGLSPDQLILFIGTFTIMTAIFVGLFLNNFFGISREILKGELDVFIVKPISLQFFVTTRFVDIVKPIPNVIAGTALIVIGWSRLGASTGIMHILSYIAFMICGTVLAYSLFLIPQILAFWTIKTGGGNDITSRLWDFNNMPMKIYNKWMQRIGIFVVPVFVITNFPVMAVINDLSIYYRIWGVAISIFMFVCARLLWNIAIKQYSSAGG